jgi:hypothetical protein
MVPENNGRTDTRDGETVAIAESVPVLLGSMAGFPEVRHRNLPRDEIGDARPPGHPILGTNDTGGTTRFVPAEEIATRDKVNL